MDSSASGSGGAAPWGTLEELLLVGAISRHGAGDWNAVACELQTRSKLFAMPASYFSPEVCKNKFDVLNGRYTCTKNHRRDKEPENHWPWFEEIRKRRVAQLKRELERHDGSILLLQQKLKRLKTERLIPHKQQDATTRSHLERPAQEFEAPDSETKSPTATLDEPVTMVVLLPLTEQKTGSDAVKPSDEPVQALQPVKNKYEVGVSEEDGGPTQMDAEVPQEVECVERKREEHARSQVNAAMQENVDADVALPTATGDKTIVSAQLEVSEKSLAQAGKIQLSPGAKEAVEEEGSCGAVEGVSFQPVNGEASQNKEDLDGDKVVEAKASAPPADNEVKSGGEAEEKEGSTSEASQEKTDESHVAAAQVVEVQPEKMETGSPASANNIAASPAEGSASAHEHEGTRDGDSQMEKSEACSQPDDMTPTSRRSNKGDRELSPAMQSHLEWLRSLCDHKLGPMFMQRQENQEDARYEQAIRKHIDLNVIKARLEEGAYSGSSEFFRDIVLLFSNFIVYYPPTSQEYNAASVLKKLAMEEFEKVSKAEESSTKQDRANVTRKRDTEGSSESSPTTQASTVEASAPKMSVSENSKSKSASVSLSVRSSKGGDEDDTREGGEPEVSGKSKPLRAYGRKNRASVSKERHVKESSLETIVKKEAALAAAKDVAAPSTPVTATTANRDKPKESKKSPDAPGNAAAEAAAAAPPPPPEPTSQLVELPAVTPRGVRNKRSASAKDFPQRTGKRNRRA